MTTRREFLKKASLAAPATVLAGNAEIIPVTDISQGQDNTGTLSGNGWLDVRDCGASGSTFRTTAVTRGGSKQIIVTDIGDFKAGQGVMVSGCNIRYEKIQMWSTGIPYVTHQRKVENSVEVRGYDGSAGSWMIYVIDIAPTDSNPAFRWSDDLGRNWHPEVPVTHEWQPLGGGIEIKLNQRDWEAGYVIAFGARDQLISRIVSVEGNVLTLEDEANRSVDDAIVRHNDTLALQTAIDRARDEKLNVFIPVGHYMLAKTINVENASAITIEGSCSEDTVLDISEGEGPCFTLKDGIEVNIRNLRMLGFMGFDERDKAGSLPTKGASYIWGFGLKHCKAVLTLNTERVLVENCHASRMSGECFSSSGRGRGTAKPGQSYTHSITYLRCSVTDCARNAFDDVMGFAESTSVLNCRIVDVGGCCWEGCVRFGKFVGNYVRNAGTVATGNLGAAKLLSDPTYPDLGSGQHIIADNVFESIVPYGGAAIRSNRGATQVIIRNNLFINFNSSAIEVVNNPSTNESTSSNATITGNIFDMTSIGQKPALRTAIVVGCNEVIVSDNQIYVRGNADPLVTGIRLTEPALYVIVNNNLIRNCGAGIISERGGLYVGGVIDEKTFVRCARPDTPPERINPDMYNGWKIVWRNIAGGKLGSRMSVIESFNPRNFEFKIKEPCEMKKGERYEVIAPSLNWTIQNNTITDCLRPVVLDSYGSRTSMFTDNLVSRVSTNKVSAGVEVHGWFQFINNRITGFDEEGATAVAVYPDAIGQTCKSVYRGNIFEKCFNVITENRSGLWKASISMDNMTLDCTAGIPH